MPEESGPARTVRKAMPAVTNHQVEPERISVRLNERFADGINDAIKHFIIEQEPGSVSVKIEGFRTWSVMRHISVFAAMA